PAETRALPAYLVHAAAARRGGYLPGGYLRRPGERDTVAGVRPRQWAAHRNREARAYPAAWARQRRIFSETGSAAGGTPPSLRAWPGRHRCRNALHRRS